MSMSSVKRFLMTWHSYAVVGLSFNSPKTVKISDFVAANCDKSLVFVVSFCKSLYTLYRWDYFCYFLIDRCLLLQVGAMAHGKVDADYIDDFISGYYLNNFVFISNPSFAVLFVNDWHVFCIWERTKFIWYAHSRFYFKFIGSTYGYTAYCIWERMKFLWCHSF